jgi:hypothetical protein
MSPLALTCETLKAMCLPFNEQEPGLRIEGSIDGKSVT